MTASVARSSHSYKIARDTDRERIIRHLTEPCQRLAQQARDMHLGDADPFGYLGLGGRSGRHVAQAAGERAAALG
jgi:hypothetical protein